MTNLVNFVSQVDHKIVEMPFHGLTVCGKFTRIGEGQHRCEVYVRVCCSKR